MAVTRHKGLQLILGAALLVVSENAVGAAPARADTSYTITSQTAALPVAGRTDTGNHCDDCVTSVSPGFAVRIYGSTSSTINVSSNGNVQFDTASIGYHNSTLPDPNFGTAILVLWDDLRTDGEGNGVFSTVTGNAGQRALTLEWRATQFDTAQPVDVAIVLHEDTSNFEVYYLTLPPSNGATATEGVQQTGVGPATQWGYDEANVASGQELAYSLSPPKVIPPTVSKAPYQSLNLMATVGSRPYSVNLPITVSWQVAAGSAAICTTQIQRSVNRGAWSPVPLGSTSGTTTTDVLTVAGGRYQYRVAVTGCDGGTTGWVAGLAFNYSLLQETGTQWSYKPATAWKAVSCVACSSGKARYTVSKGASASLTIPNAYNIGLVMETGPNRGNASVTVDGRSYTVTTYATVSGYRLVTFKHGWPVSGPHTVTVANLATTGHPRIDIDAAVVLTAT